SVTIGTGTPAPGVQGSTPPRRTSVTPGLWTQYTFSDNIDLRGRGQETKGWLLEVSPFVQVDLNSPRAVGSVFYAARGLVYGGDTTRDNEIRNDLRASADFRLTDQALRLSTQAYVFDVNRTPFGTASFDPGARSTTRTTYKRFDVSPYVVGRAGDSDYELRYRAAWIDPGAGFIPNVSQGVSYAAGTPAGSARVGWILRGDVSRYAYDNGFNYNATLVEALATWSPTPLLRLGVGANYAANSALANADGKTSGFGPSVGLDWRPDPRTQLAARWSSTYYSNIVAVAAAHQTGRVRVGLTYDRGIRDGNQSGLVYFDPSRVFATPASSNPALAAERGQAFETLTTAGPVSRDPALSVGAPLTSVSTLSPIVDAQALVASMQIAAPRTAVLVTAYVSNQRPALRVPGFENATDLDTWGVQGRYDYRLDARTTAILIAAYQSAQSTATGAESTLLGGSVGLRYQLTAQAALLGTLRTARQRAVSGPAVSYDEHAASVAGEYRF
ncbi:MAG: TIGR03016 family PEP-CTERM system-associated outer membrane protein, partial [Burkholderiales bacterium]